MVRLGKVGRPKLKIGHSPILRESIKIVPTIICLTTQHKTLFKLKHVLRKTQGFFEEAQNFAAVAPGAQVDSETGEEERIRLLNRANGII